MKQETRHEEKGSDLPGTHNTRHEQEDAASRDYRHQREGGYKKEQQDKPKQTPP